MHDRGAIDAVERRFWRDLWQTAVTDAVEERGVVLQRFGPIQASLVVDLPMERRMNLVLGAAGTEAVKRGHLEAALEWMEFFGIDYLVPLTPEMPETEAAEELLAASGYEPDGGCVRFVRDASPPDSPAPPELRVVELAEYQHETFSVLVAEGLELTPWAGTFFFDLALRAGWRCYLALIDDIPIATAATLTRRGVAGLCLASTVPLAQELGCQSALLRRQILDAAAAGCHTLFLETGESLTAHPATCRPEILEAGFEEAYERVNWARSEE